MTSWFIRDFELEDLEAALQLEQQSSTAHQVPLFGIAQVVEGIQKGDPAVVAVAAGAVIGTTISRVDGDHAWIIRIALSPQWRQRGLGSAMLGEIEHRLLSAGVRRLSALLPDAETGSAAFTHSGFVAREHVTYYEKVEVVSPAATRVLSSLGGVLPAPGL
jgi:GNAT superfamily N-acetyltransferase